MSKFVKLLTYLPFLLLSNYTLLSFNGNKRFSNEFYAAQKYFYAQAKAKFPKLAGDPYFPEIPIKGTASLEELKNINGISDYFEARQKFSDEVLKYPELIYPEIFSFLNGHPGLTVASSNKAKFEALEKYFYPFLYVFSNDKHYSFNSEIKSNPCPLVFVLKDEKKNNISFSISNSSKKAFEFDVNEGLSSAYLTITGKRPIVVKAGASATIKLTINSQKLKADSSFRSFNFVFADPTQPRVKIIVPVILLPSKDFLNLPPQFCNLNLTYSTFFKHISLQKEKASYPENCPNGDCSGKKTFLLRSPDKLMSEYKFGDLCTIQYNLSSSCDPIYNVKTSHLNFVYHELGSIKGADRNCAGTQPGTEVYCPPDAPNNGKEIYGSRKIEFTLVLPPGKNYDLKINLNITDLIQQPFVNNELSWLQEKKFVVTITDEAKNLVFKEFMNGTGMKAEKKDLTPGNYFVAVFPATEDGPSLHPSFEMQHLNHATRSRFDFSLGGSFTLQSYAVISMKK